MTVERCSVESRCFVVIFHHGCVIFAPSLF